MGLVMRSLMRSLYKNRNDFTRSTLFFQKLFISTISLITFFMIFLFIGLLVNFSFLEENELKELCL